MQKRTAIADLNQKLDIIEHLNLDHRREVLLIAKHHSPTPVISAHISDIFVEGLELAIQTAEKIQPLFVGFELKGELEENVLYLAFKAMAALGEPMSKNQNQYFTVVQSHKLTNTMWRVEVQSPMPIHMVHADFAYLFDLKKLQKTQNANNQPNPLIFKAMLWLMKRLGERARKKMMQNMYRYSRYYTVRQCWQQGDLFCAYIDIFIHGDSFGARFVHSLQAGDMIKSTHEYTGHSAHLNEGKALLVGDETALPAIATMLENWQNPQWPQLILVLHDAQNLQYLQELDAFKNPNITPIVLLYQDDIGSQLQTHLNAIHAEQIWAGLRADLSKMVRHHYRAQNIKAAHNRATAYWQ